MITNHTPLSEEEAEAESARIAEERRAAVARLRANPPPWAKARVAAFQAGMKQEPPLEPEVDWAALLEGEQRHRANEYLLCACRYAYDAGISEEEFIAAARNLFAATRRKAEIDDRL